MNSLRSQENQRGRRCSEAGERYERHLRRTAVNPLTRVGGEPIARETLTSHTGAQRTAQSGDSGGGGGGAIRCNRAVLSRRLSFATTKKFAPTAQP